MLALISSLICIRYPNPAADLLQCDYSNTYRPYTQNYDYRLPEVYTFTLKTIICISGPFLIEADEDIKVTVKFATYNSKTGSFDYSSQVVYNNPFSIQGDKSNKGVPVSVIQSQSGFSISGQIVALPESTKGGDAELISVFTTRDTLSEKFHMILNEDEDGPGFKRFLSITSFGIKQRTLKMLKTKSESPTLLSHSGTGYYGSSVQDQIVGGVAYTVNTNEDKNAEYSFDDMFDITLSSTSSSGSISNNLFGEDVFYVLPPGAGAKTKKQVEEYTKTAVVFGTDYPKPAGKEFDTSGCPRSNQPEQKRFQPSKILEIGRNSYACLYGDFVFASKDDFIVNSKFKKDTKSSYEQFKNPFVITQYQGDTKLVIHKVFCADKNKICKVQAVPSVNDTDHAYQMKSIFTTKGPFTGEFNFNNSRYNTTKIALTIFSKNNLNITIETDHRLVIGLIYNETDAYEDTLLGKHLQVISDAYERKLSRINDHAAGMFRVKATKIKEKKSSADEEESFFEDDIWYTIPATGGGSNLTQVEEYSKQTKASKHVVGGLSGGAIAGIVIAILIVIAIIVVLVLFLVLRNKSSSSNEKSEKEMEEKSEKKPENKPEEKHEEKKEEMSESSSSSKSKSKNEQDNKEPENMNTNNVETKEML